MIRINLNDVKSFSSFRDAGLKQNPQFDDSAVRLGYSRLRNKHRGTLINFWNFFQGLRPY